MPKSKTVEVTPSGTRGHVYNFIWPRTRSPYLSTHSK